MSGTKPGAEDDDSAPSTAIKPSCARFLRETHLKVRRQADAASTIGNCEASHHMLLKPERWARRAALDTTAFQKGRRTGNSKLLQLRSVECQPLRLQPSSGQPPRLWPSQWAPATGKVDENVADTIEIPAPATEIVEVRRVTTRRCEAILPKPNARTASKSLRVTRSNTEVPRLSMTTPSNQKQAENEEAEVSPRKHQS
jgi:hypothetical protein